MGDWITLKFARRNNGISETENRLWIYMFPVIAYPFGFILWGVGAAHAIHCMFLYSTFPKTIKLIWLRVRTRIRSIRPLGRYISHSHHLYHVLH